MGIQFDFNCETYFSLIRQNDALVFFRSLIYFTFSKKVISPFFESNKLDTFLILLFGNFFFIEKKVFLIKKLISNGPFLLNKDIILKFKNYCQFES